MDVEGRRSERAGMWSLPSDSDSGAVKRGSGARWVLKRVCDVAIASLVLVLTSPILLVSAILIKLDSPGPVIARDVRVGKDGALFEMLRLRSTLIDTEAMRSRSNEPQLTLAAPPRSSSEPEITRVGRVLCWASIDELPQFWNVLRGEMSLIGPKPSKPGPESTELDAPPELVGVLPGMSGTWRELDRSKAS